MAGLGGWMQQRWQRWLARRIPRQRELVLNQRRIFIFPTRAGLWFLIALLIMLLAAVNYQNNLAFALMFWLLSLMLVSLLHTYMNLSGLRLKAMRGHPSFAGENAQFDLQLSCRGQCARRALTLAWPGQGEIRLPKLSGRVELKLFYPAGQRGWLRPPRLKLESEYPLGLVRAWTWVELEWAALIYPRPQAVALPAAVTTSSDGRELRASAAGEEFYAFRAYQPGDSLRRVLWKSYARGGALQTLQFAEAVDERLWLDFDSFGGDAEQRLRGLCYWVLTLSGRDRSFGLRLPGQELVPATGPGHRDSALRMLALFPGGCP